jgi:hypothetical protein
MATPKEIIIEAFGRALFEEKKRLFAPLVQHLADRYGAQSAEVAKLCDEQLDPTGNLLGWVRNEVALRRERKAG